MVEARVLSLVGAALLRLKKHPPKKCEADPAHGEVEPVLGSLELTLPEIDAAVYACANDRCAWRRFDKLAPAPGGWDVPDDLPVRLHTCEAADFLPRDVFRDRLKDVTEKFTVNRRDEE